MTTKTILTACGAALAVAASANAQHLLAENGPLSSMPGAHETGADLIWSVPAGASVGVSATPIVGYRLAQPFQLEAEATIGSVVVYGYQQGAITGPTIDFLGVELWDGKPGEAGSARIAGDVEADALDRAEFSGAYAALNGVTHTTDRPVFALAADDLGWSVQAGEYWLVWSMDGSLDGGPYSPYLGSATEPVLGEAMQRVLSVWVPATSVSDGGGTQVSLPIAVYGQTTCAGDCDGDGEATLFDFLCFFNAFATGDLAADCDGDGELTLGDYQCFQEAFAAGCS